MMRLFDQMADGNHEVKNINGHEAQVPAELMPLSTNEYNIVNELVHCAGHNVKRANSGDNEKISVRHLKFCIAHLVDTKGRQDLCHAEQSLVPVLVVEIIVVRIEIQPKRIVMWVYWCYQENYHWSASFLPGYEFD